MYAIGFFSLALWFGCSTEARIEQRIEEANYCSTADDCVYVGSECPFGCAILVNRQQAAEILQLLERHQESCMYDCVAWTDIVCEDQRCEAVFEE